MAVNRIYIIIPVYNRKHFTRECLLSLRIQTFQNFKVIVVDDGSTDGTGEMIEKEFSDVILLKGDGNLWWTGAMKKGMEFACQQGAELLIWLNDDCLPAYDAIDHIYRYCHNHPDTIAAASCYVTCNETPIFTGFKGRQRLAASPGEVIVVEGCSGYCVGVPATIVRRIGYPDVRRFPHYGGDGMYILKATRYGYNACILGSAKVMLIEEPEPTHKFLNQAKTNPDWKYLFWNKKSRYHMPSQFYYHMNKYGVWLGMPLFLIKLLIWLGKLMQLKLRGTLQH